jgi:hypothetical protein
VGIALWGLGLAASVGCGSACPRHGAQRFFAVLASEPSDGGSCAASLSGTVLFSSDTSATFQLDEGASGPCAADYQDFGDNLCELTLLCQFDGGGSSAAQARLDVVYAGNQSLLQRDGGFQLARCTYGWSLEP